MNNLDTSNWGKFELGNLFVVDTGKDLIYSELDAGTYPVVGHKALNNGITTKTKFLEDYILYDNISTISLADRGNFYAAVQPFPFYIGTRVKALKANFNSNKNLLLFIATVINKEQFRFAYGRNCCNKTETTIIKLPIDKYGNPDWDFMNSYIENLYKKYLKLTYTKNKHTKQNLNIEKWIEFKIDQLFYVDLAKGDIKTEDIEEDFGNIPLISSGENTNGIAGFIAKGDGISEKFNGNKITVDMFGNPFYQPKPFFSVSHGRVNILSPKFKMNKYTALFLCSLIKKEQYRFNYGRAVYSNTIRDEYIKLPTDKKGEPDWQYMEDYIKSLPYADLI